MLISNPSAWVRTNKKAFANRMITNAGVTPHLEPAAFFMAGLPGAGKTEFTKNLIADLKLAVVRIDMDEIATQIDGYSPEKAYAFKLAASSLQGAVFDRAKHRKVDFIMDGTFGSPKANLNIEQTLYKGYIVKVFYLHQLPHLAWEFTQAREKVEKRQIDMGEFIDTYFKVQENIRGLVVGHLQNVSINIVLKDKDNRIGKVIENVDEAQIDELFAKSYNREELEKDLKL